MAPKKFPKIITLNTRNVTVKLTKIVVGPKGRARAKTSHLVTNVARTCAEPVSSVSNQPIEQPKQVVEEEIKEVDLPPKPPKAPSRVSRLCDFVVTLKR